MFMSFFAIDCCMYFYTYPCYHSSIFSYVFWIFREYSIIKKKSSFLSFPMFRQIILLSFLTVFARTWKIILSNSGKNKQSYLVLDNN